MWFPEPCEKKSAPHRVAVNGCCEWCKEFAGKYLYEEAPESVFRRHDNCARSSSRTRRKSTRRRRSAASRLTSGWNSRTRWAPASIPISAKDSFMIRFSFYRVWNLFSPSRRKVEWFLGGYRIMAVGTARRTYKIYLSDTIIFLYWTNSYRYGMIWTETNREWTPMKPISRSLSFSERMRCCKAASDL